MKARMPKPLSGQEIAATKAQWLLILALNEELHIGERRMRRVMKRYNEIINDYMGYMKDEVADEKLLRRIQQIFPEVDKLYRDEDKWVRREK